MREWLVATCLLVGCGGSDPAPTCTGTGCSCADDSCVCVAGADCKTECGDSACALSCSSSAKCNGTSDDSLVVHAKRSATHEGRAPLFVRPAWARPCRCKSGREETILIEANCNCGRATDRGEEAGSETAGRWTRTRYEAAPSGASEQTIAKLRWSRLRRRRSGGRAGKGRVLTWGDLASGLKGPRVSGARSQQRP